MLRGIRNASANWLGKLVMAVVVGFLAISFAIWGIGDIFRGFGRAAVASVGGNEISAEEFRNIYTERLQQIAQRAGRPIPPDQARALGLDRQILGQIITERALDEWAQRMGLGITDEEVARAIRAIPAFHGPDGQFSHELFLQRLRAAGYTERRFVNEQRRGMVRQHLTETISGLTTTPKVIVEAINAFQNERRSIEYVTLTQAQAGDIPAPSAEELAAYFEQRKALFRAPEYRKLAILRLTPEDVAKWIQVSDEEARKYYEERRARYTTPGQRHVLQIIFPSEEEAQAAKQRINAGTAFEEIARERGLSPSDIDLGMVSRQAFSSAPAVADAAFSLSEGAVSDPVQSRLGYALVKVVKIEPDRVKSFEEAAAEIRAEIVRERTRAEITQKHNQLEDERAGGATLAEAAQKIGLAATTIEAVDRSGRDPSGAPVADLPAGIDVLGPAFSARVGVEPDAIRLQDGGYIFFEVLEITPSKERAFEEVKDRVEARWRADQVAERLRKKAEAMVEKLKEGASLADLAAQEQLQLATETGLRRNGQSEAVSAAAVAVAFRTPKGQAASADGKDPAERIVLRVTDVTVEPLDAESAAGQRAQENVRNAEGEDLLRQYIVYIERQLGTTVNADALRRVVGGESF